MYFREWFCCDSSFWCVIHGDRYSDLFIVPAGSGTCLKNSYFPLDYNFIFLLNYKSHK